MKKYIITALLIIVVSIIGCATLQGGKVIPMQHPEKVTEKPICSDCHDKGDVSISGKPFASYNHNETYFKKHGKVANGSQAVCQACHKEQFCSDCHANKEELVPSRKLGNKPDLSSPHKGDYFSKHKIEGRLNQAECFGCHGRRNNASCKECH